MHSGHIELANRAVNVLIPSNELEMQRGLQGYDEPLPDEGMFFMATRFPQESMISMWMAKVTYPLCMAWLGSNGTVTFIEHDRQPGDKRTYSFKAAAVVELAAKPWRFLRIGMPWYG